MKGTPVMHKRQLIDQVARRSGLRGLTRRQVRDALHGILDVITDEMAEGRAVTISGFGRFEAKEHKGRRVVGMDGGEYEVESRLVPSFKPYPSLRAKLQGKTDERMMPKPRPLPPRWSDDPFS
ncbi:MAG: HU family DNA-binding protein [Anaerolineae bacterium]|nr:HU family DNA-binding protein [Anaerolineae bacterium]